MLEIVRDRAVHIEACPTSSWLTGGFGPKTRPWSEHPVRAFHRHGLSCCVSTDDPAIANICLVGEWRRCLDEVGTPNPNPNPNPTPTPNPNPNPNPSPSRNPYP